MSNTTRFLLRMGISETLLGSAYIKAAMDIISADESVLHKRVCSGLYKKIAEEHSATPVSVERAIRHAVEVAWERGDIDFQEEVFGFVVQASTGHPTNSEFLARMYYYLAEMESEGRGWTLKI